VVLQEQHPFRKLIQKRVKPVAAFNDDPARHAAYDLLVNISMQVWMEPEQSDVPLRDFDFVVKGLSGADVDENIVPVFQRRNVQPVEVQVCILCEPIVESHCQLITRPQAPDRGHVLAVVERPLKLMAFDCVGGGSGNEIDMQTPVLAVEHVLVRQSAGAHVCKSADAVAAHQPI
jgi:hypothetical protein